MQASRLDFQLLPLEQPRKNELVQNTWRPAVVELLELVLLVMTVDSSLTVGLLVIQGDYQSARHTTRNAAQRWAALFWFPSSSHCQAASPTQHQKYFLDAHKCFCPVVFLDRRRS